MLDNLKPKCNLIGIRNVFDVIATVSKSLRDAGLSDKAVEFSDKAVRQQSYDTILALCMEYVDVDDENIDLESEITEDEMIADYDLWLADQGYIVDNEHTRQEYEQWIAETCGRR